MEPHNELNSLKPIPESGKEDRYLVICGGDGYQTCIATGFDKAIAEFGRMHVGSDEDMDDEMILAGMKHAMNPDNWSGDMASYDVDYEDGWAKIIKMSPEIETFFDKSKAPSPESVRKD